MDAFTFILRQFWVSLEMNKCGVQRLFEARQMVPSTRATLQVTSPFLGTFREKIWPTRKSQKMSQKQPTLKVIIHAFRLFWGPISECHGMPPRDTATWEVTGRESCGLERICRCLYVHFETILGFTRNEQMGCSEAFGGNINGAKYPRNITSHVGFIRNVSEENMTRPEKVQTCPKNS